MVNIKPVQDYILIEPSRKEVVSSGGVYLPETSSEEPQRGTVVSVSKDVKSNLLSKGDTVIYKKWGGNEVEVNGSKYLFVKEEDVLAKL